MAQASPGRHLRITGPIPSLYTTYLKRFDLQRAERFFELPLDSVTAHQLKKAVGRGELPASHRGVPRNGSSPPGRALVVGEPRLTRPIGKCSGGGGDAGRDALGRLLQGSVVVVHPVGPIARGRGTVRYVARRVS